MAQLQNLTINNTDIFDLFYPVGSIYETSNADFNPNNVWSGTWERIKGKVIVGVDENDNTFASSKLTGGEKTHTLTVAEMPSHGHGWEGVNDGATVAGQTGRYPFRIYQDRTPNWPGTASSIYNTGGNGSHNNLQPYYTAYIWERIS